MSASIIFRAAGPANTTIIAGKMNKISGAISLTAVFWAFSSAAWRRLTRSESDWFLKSPHIFIDFDGNLPNVSSTQVRESASDGRFTGQIADVDPDVLKYISANKLYREER